MCAREAPGVDILIAAEVVDLVRVLRGVELEVLPALRAGGEDRAVVRDPLDGVRVVIGVGLPDQVVVGVGVLAALNLDDSGCTAGGADQGDQPPRLSPADLDVGQVRPPGRAEPWFLAGERPDHGVVVPPLRVPVVDPHRLGVLVDHGEVVARRGLGVAAGQDRSRSEDRSRSQAPEHCAPALHGAAFHGRHDVRPAPDQGARALVRCVVCLFRFPRVSAPMSKMAIVPPAGMSGLPAPDDAGHLIHLGGPRKDMSSRWQ
jgi:hypothetical protein